MVGPAGARTPEHIPPPTMAPLLSYYERETIPRKIILATSYYKNMENYGGLSDCEELVGVTHTEEVKVSPVLTTATKVLFPNTISVRVFEVGKVLLGCSAS